MATTKPTRVFISYSHDSQSHRESVLALANRLRREGIDCQLDQYESAPAEGWLRWMKRQIETADFVLMICTELYEKRFAGESEASAGLGVNWESMVITQAIYAAANNHDKFIPLILLRMTPGFVRWNYAPPPFTTWVQRKVMKTFTVD